MIPIGNDVVDFQYAQQQSNWQRKGFLTKIFTSKEQDLIAESENQEKAVWQLWSQKEAVYKIIRQLGAPRGFVVTVKNLKIPVITDGKGYN